MKHAKQADTSVIGQIFLLLLRSPSGPRIASNWFSPETLGSRVCDHVKAVLEFHQSIANTESIKVMIRRRLGCVSGVREPTLWI
jgi:hypothetical protein